VPTLVYNSNVCLSDNIPTMGLMAELLDGRIKEGEYIFIHHPMKSG